MKERKCPLCGETYNDIPAVSRDDNETLICPDCGTRQALADLEISANEIESIIEIVHKYAGKR